MIKVYIPDDFEFEIYEPQLRKMYNESKEKICDTNNFDFIKNNTLFYSFISDGTLIGAIYLFFDDGKLFLNAYAGRGHHEINVECVKMSTKWFKCDIYAEAQNRASALCLLKSGFKRVGEKSGKLFVFRQSD